MRFTGIFIPFYYYRTMLSYSILEKVSIVVVIILISGVVSPPRGSLFALSLLFAICIVTSLMLSFLTFISLLSFLSLYIPFWFSSIFVRR